MEVRVLEIWKVLLQHWRSYSLCRSKRFADINYKNKTITIAIIPAVRTDSKAAYRKLPASTRRYCGNKDAISLNKSEMFKIYKGSNIWFFLLVFFVVVVVKKT